MVSSLPPHIAISSFGGILNCEHPFSALIQAAMAPQSLLRRTSCCLQADIPLPLLMRSLNAGSSLSDLREFVVEGTSFNPAAGGIVGRTSLTKNLEVLHRLCAGQGKWSTMTNSLSLSRRFSYDSMLCDVWNSSL